MKKKEMIIHPKNQIQKLKEAMETVKKRRHMSDSKIKISPSENQIHSMKKSNLSKLSAWLQAKLNPISKLMLFVLESSMEKDKGYSLPISCKLDFKNHMP